LTEDASLRRRLGLAGRDHAVGHFSWDAIVDQLIRLYAGLASGDGGLERDGVQISGPGGGSRSSGRVGKRTLSVRDEGEPDQPQLGND
jgi:hypothetical protein